MKNIKFLPLTILALLGMASCGPTTSSPTNPSVDPTTDPSASTPDPTTNPGPAFVAPESISLIGTIGDGSDWSTDYDLTTSDEGHTWTISDFLMMEGEEWKVRMNHNWGDVGKDNWGYSYLDEESKALFSGSDNIVVTSSAYYSVSFAYDGYSSVISVSKTGDYVVPGWTEDELALISQYAYGADIPYYEMPAGSGLYYDETYGCLSAYSETASSADFDAYDALLSAYPSAEVIYSEDYYNEYRYPVETEDGTRYIVVDIYLVDDSFEESADGTNLWLDIYDIYDYEWDYEYYDYVAQVLSGDDHAFLPEYLDAEFYYLDLTFLDYGVGVIDCINANVETAMEDYTATLQAMNFTIVEEGSAVSKSFPLAIEYGVMDNTFSIYFGYDESYGNSGDQTSAAQSFMTTLSASLFGSSTNEFEYDEESGMWYLATYFTNYNTNTDEFRLQLLGAVVDTFLPEDLTVYYEPGIYAQGVYGIWDGDGFLVQILVYYNSQIANNVVQFAVMEL